MVAPVVLAVPAVVPRVRPVRPVSMVMVAPAGTRAAVATAVPVPMVRPVLTLVVSSLGWPMVVTVEMAAAAVTVVAVAPAVRPEAVRPSRATAALAALAVRPVWAGTVATAQRGP